MRFVVPLALLFLVGCEPPAVRPLAPDLRINGQNETGEPVSFRDGDSVDLWPLDLSCFRKHTLPIQNVGTSPAHFRVSTTSTLMAVEAAPQSLAPGEDGIIELLLSPVESATGRFEAELTIEIDGQPTIHFALWALVVSVDWDLIRRFDFGGVEVGSSRTLGDSLITGLAGDFSETNGGQLQFSPTRLGFQRLDGRLTKFLHCPFISQVSLFGDGVASVLTGPTELNFGEVPFGASHEREIVIVNYSFDPLAIQVADPFTLVSATTPDVATRSSLTLIPGSSTLRVRFSPSAMGPANQELRVTAGTRTLTIPIRGNGTP